MEINFVAHLGSGLEGSPWGVREQSTCFPGHAAGGLFPVDAGVSRNEASQSRGVMCVCWQGGGWMVAVAPVQSTCCPERFLGYIIPDPEKLESLPPLLHQCTRRDCKVVILGNRRHS